MHVKELAGTHGQTCAACAGTGTAINSTLPCEFCGGSGCVGELVCIPRPVGVTLTREQYDQFITNNSARVT
jgi:hypothetical protein